MESHQANQQFKAIKKWRARHQNSVQREGGFLLFSQKKLASLKAQLPGGEIKNGRDPATLQVTQRQLNWPNPSKEVTEFSVFCLIALWIPKCFTEELNKLPFKGILSSMWMISWDLLKSVAPSSREGAKNWDKCVVRSCLWMVWRSCFCLLVGYLVFSCTQSKSLLHGQLSASWMRSCLNTKDQRAEPALASFSKKILLLKPLVHHSTGL